MAHGAHLRGSALLGRAHQDPLLEVHQARKVTLRPRHEQPVQFDGEDGGRTRELTVEIVAHAVSVLLPADAPALSDSPPLSAVNAAAQTVSRSLRVPLLLALVLAGIVFLWRGRRFRG